MKVIFRIILLVALAELGVWLWAFLFPSPEKVIRKQFGEMARLASFSSDESDLARLGAAHRLAGYCGTNVEVDLDFPGLPRHDTISRDEITGMVLAASSRAGAMKVKFPDVNVTVSPDRQSALVDLTMEANVSGEPDPVVQEMKFTLQKAGGQWLITRVETIHTLS
jgi:hypothetical protein